MTKTLQQILTQHVKELQTGNDPSHDFNHIMRVLNMSLRLSEQIEVDSDILIPASLFHDIVVHKKNSPESSNETNESASIAEKVLNTLPEYPKEKIPAVITCIKECSFSKGLPATSIESKILQDSDRLEATGAIAIMRTFSSGGQMNSPLYPEEDPLCKNGSVRFRSSLDLFFNRLLLVKDTMHTPGAKKIAEQRTDFLKKFLLQLEKELTESGVL